ncbi:DUF3558 domain-containing protein [Amycolatopsis panacis]|uniref:DUF3558 domain-containing protein n=1 Tax=Amycolatopsis panacis TaxID=2340917 RepID=A0A419HYL6_9PSEU|nr:DUF3558 domain-containing protein [Amycolatopsis panacis]RJQ82202.1 DUF3558 domain-containing protein [Amycolatopsis panacis]
MRRSFLALSGAVVAILVAAGCSGSAPGAAVSSPISSPTAGALPHSGAPKVEHPLPASVLSGDPCQEALKPDQVEQILGIAPEGKRHDNPALGTACDWNNDTTGAAATVGYVTQVHDGLSAVYKNTKPLSSVWREFPSIQGFPAAAHTTISSGTQGGFCQVSIGISDSLSVDASLTVRRAKIGKADACELAPRVADMVVTNLRKKAGM